MNERIRELRKALNMTQQEFADALNIKRNTVASYETGKSNASDAAVVLICRTFNANESWLRTGKGDMFIKKTREEEISEFFGSVLSSDSSFKRELVEILAKLDESAWVQLAQVAKSFIDAANKKEE